MIGGRIGAFRIASGSWTRAAGLPVPFMPGTSDLVFQNVLSHWMDRAVPGLTRDQFLRPALPWTVGQTH